MIDYVVFIGLILISIVFAILVKKKDTDTPNDSPYVIQMNKCESPIERRMLKSLWMNGYNPLAQYKVGYYRLDFALLRYKIAIECDGKQWHSSPKQKAHDRKRDAYLRSRGWKVLRFSGSSINSDMSKVIKRIDKAVSLRDV